MSSGNNILKYAQNYGFDSNCGFRAIFVYFQSEKSIQLVPKSGNVKNRPKNGRIMWKLTLKIARIMWKAPIKLWEFTICKSRIQQITKQIYLSYLIDISNNMI